MNSIRRKTLGFAFATALIAVCFLLPAGASAQAEELALGGESGCVAAPAGGLNCWGRHPAAFYIKGGPFLPAISDELPTPVDVIDGTVTDIAISREQKCAVADSRAYCWGEHSGAPHENGIRDSTVIPVPVPGFESGVTDIAIGGQGGTCFVKSGAVSCWLGGDWPEPLIDSGATSISANQSLNCAVVTGQAVCWGWGANRVGREGGADEYFSPAVSAGLSAGVESVSVGYDFSCAIVNGGARCWGKNDQGQLGDGTTTDTSGAESRQVSGLTSGVTAISVGSKVACAVVSGAVKCWGSNAGGLFGNGSLDSDDEPGLPSTPATVPGLDSGVDAVAVDYNWNACARQSGAVKCWGRGALGNEVTTEVNTPTAVLGGAGITNLRLDGGGSTACGIENSAAKCWGGWSTESQTQGAFPRPLGASFDADVSTILPGSCGIVNGGLECGDGGLQASEGLNGDVVAVAIGSNYDYCASTVSVVRCWYVGSSGSGGTTYDVDTVEDVGTSITQLSVGATHSCAIASGAARCWGRNGYGQLGVPDPQYSDVPVTPTGLSAGVTSIAASDEFSCAAVSGAAKCWGLGNAYRLGNGTDQVQFEPRQIEGLGSGVKSVVAGSAHACALMVSGAIYCWGNNYAGQLGNGSYEDSTAPVLVTGAASGATEVAAGGGTTCARIDGVAKCWGSNVSGALGIGTINWHLTPIAQGPTAPKPPLAVVRSPGWNHGYDVNTIPVETFSNVEGDRECSLDGEPYGECPETLTDLSEGAHTYRVKVNYGDDKTIVGESPFNVDAFDPVITLHNLDDDLTANAGVRRFASFTVSESGGWFTCEVDDWGEIPCKPNTSYDLWFWPGTHTVTVRQGGLPNGVAATKTFQIGGAVSEPEVPTPSTEAAPPVKSLSTRAESALSLKLSSRGKYSKGTRKLTARVRLANTDLQPGASCSGSVLISASGLNAADRRVGLKLDSNNHCIASRTFSIKRASKGKRIRVTAAYAGNSLFLPATRSGAKHL